MARKIKQFIFVTLTKNLSFKRVVKIFLGSLTALIALWFSIGISILTLPPANYQGYYDCAIVLGAAVNVTEPSPVFEARIQHAIDLHQQKIVKTLIFTGGTGAGDKLSEGDAASIYAQKNGIPKKDILVERSSKTTLQNLQEAKKLMSKNHLKDAVIVSDHLHLRRSILLAKWLGISADSSATPYSKYRSWRTKMPFLLREIYFTIQFMLFRQ